MSVIAFSRIDCSGELTFYALSPSLRNETVTDSINYWKVDGVRLHL